MQQSQSQDDKSRFVLRRYRENSLNTEAAWNRFSARHGIGKRIALHRRVMVVAAAAVLLLLIGLSGKYYLDRNTPDRITVTTLAGEYKEVCLPDSTSVSLAENSVVRYDKKKYGKEKRAVEMKGKAFFEVARDEALPFSVNTKETETVVLGTSFQLEEKEQATILYVRSGRVRFTAGENSETAILTAGMSASYSTGEGLRTEEKETDVNYLSWKTHQLRFRATPLNEVIRELNRAYQVEIVNHTQGSEEAELTSFFDNMPLDELLQVINQTLDVELEARRTE
jgi:ferric-dicitrate binding protein FerR (iron transport regulator)